MLKDKIIKWGLLGLITFALSYYFFQSIDLDEAKPTLNIYTYSSFASKYGPGPKLTKAFEKDCACKVNYINSSEAQLLIEKIKKTDVKPDLVMGLDLFSKANAIEELKWKDISSLEILWSEKVRNLVVKEFIPYDWSPLTFIYRDEKYSSIKSWEDLFSSDVKLTVPDPRFSSPGLIFLYWIYDEYGDRGIKGALKQLKERVHSFPSSWSASYSLFKSGQVDMSFSYLSSPVYHWAEELDYSFQALKFNKHPFQVEYLGLPAACVNCALAEKYIKLVLSEEGQDIIMNNNYMFPVRKTMEGKGLFKELPQLKLIEPKNLDEFLRRKNELIKYWKEINKI